ncbi:hypothetical protein Taro_010151 [Colocasia esculenta]|uniref:Uncharacterized protein n=1 Tax=Colocasia esculenta TaxID=4460 RepID=A0A843U6U5_COLES|nr:hypothetical protein [Colocasia esculenta]
MVASSPNPRGPKYTLLGSWEAGLEHPREEETTQLGVSFLLHSASICADNPSWSRPKFFFCVFGLAPNHIQAGGRDSRTWYRAAQGRRDPMNGVRIPGRDFDVDPSTARMGLRARLGVCGSLNSGWISRRVSEVFPPKNPRNSLTSLQWLTISGKPCKKQ